MSLRKEKERKNSAALQRINQSFRQAPGTKLELAKKLRWLQRSDHSTWLVREK